MRRPEEREDKVDFILVGFSDHDGTRRFLFERTGPGTGPVREKFTVDADMVMARRYRISVQDLPLLCRRLLDDADGTVSRTLIFGEAQMCTHAGLLAAETEARALRKRPPRRHGPGNNTQVGTAGVRIHT
jgi:hypothetical protein